MGFPRGTQVRQGVPWLHKERMERCTVTTKPLIMVGGGEKDQSGGARQVNGVILVYDIRFQGVQASRAAKAPGAPRAPRPFPRLACRLRTEYIGLTARRGPVAPRGP